MGPFVLFLNKGNVDKQSRLLVLSERARTPHSGSMTTGCGQRPLKWTMVALLKGRGWALNKRILIEHFPP